MTINTNKLTKNTKRYSLVSHFETKVARRLGRAKSKNRLSTCSSPFNCVSSISKRKHNP
jgi:hypothetical protein